MHVLFVHQNFPAQFGHIAAHLIDRHQFHCTFVTERRSGKVGQIECVQYKVDGGATLHNHYCTRTFENTTRHALGVYEAVKAAIAGGAHGVLLSRKYSEMRLDNIRGAGRAIRELR